MCYTASENYLLVSYQHAYFLREERILFRRVEGTESIKVPYVRIINTHDWSICVFHIMERQFCRMKSIIEIPF